MRFQKSILVLSLVAGFTSLSAFADRLVCRTDSNGSAAIYNLDRGKFIDPFYAKTLADCDRTVAASWNGMTCASNSDGRTAIYDVTNDRFVDGFYSKTLDECIAAITSGQPGQPTYPPAPVHPAPSNRLICKTDSNGAAAIFNLDRNKFIDPFYAKSLSDCDRTIAASWRGLTCASYSDGKAAIYDVINDRFVDAYYSKTLDECIQAIGGS